MIEKIILEYITELENKLKQLEKEYNSAAAIIKAENDKYQKKIGNLFYKLSESRRRKVQDSINELQTREIEITDSYLKQINDLKDELSKTKSSQEYALKKIFANKPELLNDTNLIIDLVKNYPTYLKSDLFACDKMIQEVYKNNQKKFCDIAFMKSLINLDYRYIIYDMTDDDQVYREYILQLLNNIPQDNYCYEVLIKFKEELENPKVPNEGMYKIPHKFLFENLRKKVYYTSYRYDQKIDKKFVIEDYIPADIDPYREPSNCIDYISRYLYNDCRQPLSFGKKMEELYTNRDIHLLIAGCNTGTHKKIFENGYMVNAEYYGDLYRNFWDVHGYEGSFLNLFKETAWCRNEVVYVTIPKDSKNYLGSDGEILKLKEDDKTYILPEYVFGVSVMKDGKKLLIENNIPLDKRKKYKNIGAVTRGITEHQELRERASQEQSRKSR